MHIVEEAPNKTQIRSLSIKAEVQKRKYSDFVANFLKLKRKKNNRAILSDHAKVLVQLFDKKYSDGDVNEFFYYLQKRISAQKMEKIVNEATDYWFSK